MSDDVRILELEKAGWWSNPNRTNLDEVTERHVTGTCAGCGLPIWEDDTNGENYCEGCGA